MKRNGTERKYDVNGLDRCLVSFVPVPFIGSSGGGIAQVVHRSAVEQVVTLTAGVTVIVYTIIARSTYNPIAAERNNLHTKQRKHSLLSENGNQLISTQC